MNEIIQNKTNYVYLVYAPELVHWSAGIKVLHKLNQGLKDCGFESYLINHGKTSLRNKIQTYKLIKSLNQRSNTLITAIYPESIPGNPIGVQKQIRWILNTPGLLGGTDGFKNATVWSYSKKLSDEYFELSGQSSDVLFIPGLDLMEFEQLAASNLNSESHDYKLLYAQKFRALGGKPEISGSNIKEITRFNSNSTSRQETIAMIKNAKELHAYENTTVITEAQLLGIPVYCHENFGFKFLIAEVELGSEGVSWDINTPPKPNSGLVRDRILFHEKDFKNVIAKLIRKFESENPSSSLTKLHYNPFTSSLKHKVSRFKVLIKSKGIRTSLRFIKMYLMRIINRN